MVNPLLMILHRIVRSSIFSILSIFLIGACYAQPISKLSVKEIKISPRANYSALKGGRDNEKLIDGNLAVSKILWQDPNALGWQNIDRVTIDLELMKESLISSVSLITAKNESAGVFFPLNVNLFTSMDGKHYSYVSDINIYPKVVENTYQSVKLELDKINAPAKFLRLIIIPQGRMFFTDEIVITGSELNNIKSSNPVLTSVQIENTVSNNRKAEINRRSLLKKIELSNRLDISSKTELLKQIVQEKELANDNIYKKYENLISVFSVSTNSSGLSIEILSSPWNLNKALGNRKSVINTVGLTQYIAIQVINNQQKAFIDNFSLKKNKDINIQVYDLKEIKTRILSTVPDVMEPISQNQKINFSPGEKKVFILAINTSKAIESTIEFSFKNLNSNVVSIAYKTIDIGINRSYLSSLQFNVNVWPYFNYPFYRGKEKQVKEDIKQHYANVFVIPPTVLEPNNITTNHAQLKNYLKNYEPGNKVLLFLNHRGYGKSPGNFMQQSWKNKFLTWYDNALSIMKANNIAEDNIYLYPFDEVHESEIPLFKSFVSWIKTVRPETKIYATIFRTNVLSELAGLTDIYQVLISNDLKEIRPLGTNNFWVYDIMDDSKTLDPYSRYRLLSWKAYSIGAKGVGFWAYVDQYGSSVWDDFDGVRPDYNVVYDKASVLLPSRRWEAFKQGVEDYYIMNKYADKFGIDETKKLVNSVLLSPMDTAKGDEIRELMLNKLSN